MPATAGALPPAQRLVGPQRAKKGLCSSQVAARSAGTVPDARCNSVPSARRRRRATARRVSVAVGADLRRIPVHSLLAAERTVMTLDLRGMGASGAPAIGGYAVEDLKEDALAVAGSIGLRRRVDVLGHWLGGLVALELAFSTPSEVRWVVLALTAPDADDLEGLIPRDFFDAEPRTACAAVPPAIVARADEAPPRPSPVTRAPARAPRGDRRQRGPGGLRALRPPRARRAARARSVTTASGAYEVRGRGAHS